MAKSKSKPVSKSDVLPPPAATPETKIEKVEKAITSAAAAKAEALDMVQELAGKLNGKAEKLKDHDLRAAQRILNAAKVIEAQGRRILR